MHNRKGKWSMQVYLCFSVIQYSLFMILYCVSLIWCSLFRLFLIMSIRFLYCSAKCLDTMNTAIMIIIIVTLAVEPSYMWGAFLRMLESRILRLLSAYMGGEQIRSKFNFCIFYVSITSVIFNFSPMTCLVISLIKEKKDISCSSNSGSWFSHFWSSAHILIIISSLLTVHDLFAN